LSFVVAVLILSLLVMHSGNHVVKATSFDLAKDTISDSDPSATNITHDFEFNLNTAATSSAVLRITWPSEFSDISESATCPNGGTASTTGKVLDCTGVFLVSTSTITDLSATSTNPSTAGSYAIEMQVLNEGGTEIENAQVRVYIIDNVDVTATVPATLTFTVRGTTSGAVINGEATTADSATTTLSFGTISDTNQKVLGQTLEVSTNASDGFAVTVAQTANLTNAGGDDIDSFATSTTAIWSAPTVDLDDENTFGWMGVTSDDTDITAFSGTKYSGLDFPSSVAPLTVFSHDGPADGSTQDKGLAHVAFSLQISDVQEAGDYSTTITYVCTPTY